MKKIILFILLLTSISGFGQRIQLVNTYGISYHRTGADSLFFLPADTFSVPSAYQSYPFMANKGGTVYLWNTSTHVWGALSSGSGSTPTLQQVLTAGSTLTQDNTINVGNHILRFQDGGLRMDTLYLYDNADGDYGNIVMHDNILHVITPFGWDILNVYDDQGISFGGLKVYGFAGQASIGTSHLTNDRLVYMPDSTGTFSLRTKLNGVTYSSNSVGTIDLGNTTSTNIYNSDGTLSANRTVSGANHSLEFSGLSSFSTVSASSDFTATNNDDYTQVTSDGSSLMLMSNLHGVDPTPSRSYVTKDSIITQGRVGQSFYTAGTQRMVIDASGNVGIGTGSPGALLTVAGNGSNLLTIDPAAHESAIGSYWTNGILDDSYSRFSTHIESDASSLYWIMDGSSQLSKQATVTGSANPTSSNISFTADYHQFTGNVGIGTTPDSALTISGGLRINNGAAQPGYVWTASNVDGRGTWAAASGGGVSTIGTINGQTKSANGAVISGSSLYMQGVSATVPGLITTGTDTLAGVKKFEGQIYMSGIGANRIMNFNAAGTYKIYDDTSNARLQVTGNSVAITASGVGGSIVFSNGNIGVAGYVNASGNWSIGNFNNTYKLEVSGSGKFTGRLQMTKGTDVASAGNLTLGTGGNVFHITGTTTINAITVASWSAGSELILIFDASVTVKNNTAGGGGTAVMLLSGGADFSATANDVLTLVYDGTSWFEKCRSVN